MSQGGHMAIHTPAPSALAAPPQVGEFSFARDAFLLDIDGTLLDIAPTPDSVHVPATLKATLAILLESAGGAVALVSGRPLSAIDRLFAPGSLAASFHGGGKLLALGNGGSSTDAMDIVADVRSPRKRRRRRPAIDLTEDTAILTAIANDIGPDAIFSRQVIAYGHRGDVLLALSTSGNSGNVIDALAEGRRRGLETIAMVGYDGGRVASQSLADHVIVTRSEHIPRIQEAQASAYHALIELIDPVDA